MLKLHVNRDFLIVALSILVQVPLAVFLGHYYDERSFLDTGYLISSGLNPYQPYCIIVFPNSNMIGINPIIGYPPLWPLLLGLIYRLTYNFVPNLFLYNFAIKIPVLISNIALAYVTKNIMQKLNAPPKHVRFAWLFLLFNPFTLLTTSAWGEFDTLIALLCVASLYFLSKGMIVRSSVLLCLSVVLKPISLPLLGLPLIFKAENNPRKKVVYLFILVSLVAALWFLPFYLFNWSIPFTPDLATSYFRMAGGMTLFNIVELFQNSQVLPSSLYFLGYLWIPALLIAYYFLCRKSPKTLENLTLSAFALMLIFFMSRSWISEPNLNMLLPFMLILLGLSPGIISKKSLHATWILALAFIVLNFALPQLFFLVYPQIMPALGTFDVQFGTARLVARFAVTVLWFTVASKILWQVLKKKVY